MKFKDLNIRKKLLLSFGVILIGLMGFGVYIFKVIIDLNTLQEDVHKRSTDVLLIKDLQKTAYKMYQIIADAQLNGYTTAIEQEWDEHHTETQALMETVVQTTDHAEELKYAEEARLIASKIVAIFENNIVPILQANGSLSETLQYDAQIDQLIEEFQLPVQSLVESLNNEMDASIKVFHKESTQIEISTIVVCLALVIISILFIVLMIRAIANPLLKGAKYTQKIAEGDLTASIEIEQNDEVGALLASMKAMVDKLSTIISQVVGGSDQIASSSEQLSGTSEQISQGANEQASSVEEISSTMEQMLANIEQNSQNAMQTEKISTNAAQGVQKISEASMKSLTSIQTISGKISIINDIAFQTNILALNAAVEAARAGEHGRGFAVVAAEVRKLAERSKIAADEIVHLAAESVTYTENAGKLLVEIIPEIEKTANLVREIAAASVEQNSGANQVNTALQQLNSVVQQNASSSEEMASSSEELSSQAQTLSELVSYFKINNQSKKVYQKAPTPIVQKKNTSTVKKPSGQSILPKNQVADSEFESF